MEKEIQYLRVAIVTVARNVTKFHMWIALQ